MELREKLKLKKLVAELKSYRGRHTELVSVYIPAGYNLIDAVNMLRSEVSTAQNIKSKTTRKNVIDALEKIIQHLKIFKETPKNGLVVFAGNISKEEGKSDVRLWSIEPPEPLKTKLYWCDQVFVVEPLEEMLKEKDNYGLIVMDGSQAVIGLLSGKNIKKLKKIESLAPSKTIKGGMCVSEDTLIQQADGTIVQIKELKRNKHILAYSPKKMKLVYANNYEIFERKAKVAYKLFFKNPSLELTLTPEHMVFVATKNGIEEKQVEELRVGDKLLMISQIKVKPKDTGKDKKFYQLLGFMTSGNFDNGISLYHKNKNLLRKYVRIAENLFGKKIKILKNGNGYEAKISKKIAEQFSKEYKKVLLNKDIPAEVLRLPNSKLKFYLRGVFDAKGCLNSCICLRDNSKTFIKKVHLLLLRFGIISNLKISNKAELRITSPAMVERFYKQIGFSTKEKLLKKFKTRSKAEKPEKLLVTIRLSKKVKISTNKKFYDLYVPSTNNFFAHCLLVHNSQRRYDRIREQALLEYYRKVGEIASKLFLEVKNLKGVIIGGPGPIKERFYEGDYLDHRIRDKVLGVKSIGYADEFALEELVKRSEDLIKEAEIMREKELLEEFFSNIHKRGEKIVYGIDETLKALEIGALETILISEDFDWVERKVKIGNKIKKIYSRREEQAEGEILEEKDLLEIIEEKAKQFGTKIEFISNSTNEAKQFNQVAKIGGFLRYKLNQTLG